MDRKGGSTWDRIEPCCVVGDELNKSGNCFCPVISSFRVFSP